MQRRSGLYGNISSPFRVGFGIFCEKHQIEEVIVWNQSLIGAVHLISSDAHHTPL